MDYLCNLECGLSMNSVFFFVCSLSLSERERERERECVCAGCMIIVLSV